MDKTELDKIKQELRKAEDYRNRLYTESHWDEFEDYWFGRYPISLSADGTEAMAPMLTIPVLVSNLQRQIAGLVSDFRVNCTTDNPAMVPSANIRTAVLNMLIRRCRLVEEVIDAVQDTGTCGTGGLMIGYGSQYGTHIDARITGQDMSMIDEDGQRIEYNDSVKFDRPWALRAHPSTILVPKGTWNIRSAYGLWNKYVRHIDDVRADDKLDEKERKKVEPNSLDENGMEQVKGEDVILYEYTRLKDNRRIVFANHHENPLADSVDEIMVRTNRLKFHPIIFTNNSRFFWGTSDFDLEGPLAREINDIRTMQMMLRRLEIVKGFYNRKMLEDIPGGQEKFRQFINSMTSDRVMTMFGVEGNPNEFVSQFSPRQPYDLIPQLDTAKSELEQFGMGNVGELQKGILGSGRHTKYETQVAEGYHDLAMTPRRVVIRNAVLNILYDWSRMLEDFWITPHTIQTFDAAGNRVVVEFTGRDLADDSDYFLEMTLESMRPKSQQERVNEANMVLEQMTPFIQMGVVNPMSLARQWMSRVGGNWDVDALFTMPNQQPSAPIPFGQYQQQYMQQASRPGMPPPQMMQQMMQRAQAAGVMPGGPRPQGRPR